MHGRFVSRLALLLAIALVAAACSGSSEDSTTTTAAESTETTAAESTETTAAESTETTAAESTETTQSTSESLSGELSYFSMWNEGEPQQQVLAGIIEEFEAANPEVTINVIWAGREVLTPARAAITGGDSPDLIDLDAEPLYGAFVKTGESLSLAAILDQEIPGDGGNTVADVIPAAVLETYTVNGEPHLIPYEIISSGIFYDERNLDGLGLDRPATWDEFLAAAGAAVAAGQPGVEHDGLINFYNAYWLYWLIMREAGPGAFLAAASDATGESWKSPAIAAAAKNLESLVSSGSMAEAYTGSNWPEAQQVWAGGEGLFMINGTWLPSETAEYAADGFTYRMLSFPQTDGGYDSAEVYQIGWIVPSGSENLELAQAFMAFALQKDRIAGITTVAKNLTPRTDIPVPPELQDAADILAAASAAHRPYDGVQGDLPDYWNTVFMPLDDQLFFGQITADEFIDAISEATAAYWANQ